MPWHPHALPTFLLLPLVAAPTAGALDGCTGPACVVYEADAGGTWTFRCTGLGQESYRVLEAWAEVGDLHIGYVERCRSAEGAGGAYQWLGVAAAGQDAQVGWYQYDTEEGTRVCGMDVDGHALPCALGPPLTLP